MSTKNLMPSTTYASIVGRVLAWHRVQRRWEQARLARIMGVSQPSWSRIERGETAITVEQLHRFAQELKIPPHRILAEVDKAAEDLQRKNVHIRATKDEKKSESPAAWIGVAALTALILLALSKK